jgi:protein-tyrosine phosphatase
MIDFHSHILPYIDDGSKNFDMSIDMLKLAIDEGTEYICATSHFIPGELELDKGLYFKRLSNLEYLCSLKEVYINILPAMEIYMHPDLPRLYKENRIWGINNTQYLLIELPMQQLPMYTAEVMYELRLQGAVPILGHPERNFRIMKDVTLLENLVEQGMLAQVNAGSLHGIYGKEIKEFGEYLVGRNLIHLVGSDAHDDKRRTTQIKGAFETIKNKNIELYQLINENQYKIIEGKAVEVLQVKNNKKRFNFFGL